MSKSPKTSSGKTSKGSVAILSSNGRLQLRFSYRGKRHYLSLGLADSKANRKAAELRAQLIERDIAYGEVDVTLAKYRPELDTDPEEVEPAADLRELWKQWLDYRRPQLSVKTLDWFKTFTNHIERMPYHSISQAPQIRDWIVANVSPRSGKDLLMRINACCKWAIKSGMIHQNPFEGMTGDIQLPKTVKSAEDFDIDPFSKVEQDLILAAFREHPVHWKYADLVEFLLLTGCRPSEAIGLRWESVGQKKILFKEAIVQTSKGSVAKDCTKTGRDRYFPINAQLGEFIRGLRKSAGKANPQDLVFLVDAQPINYSYFSRAWGGYKLKGKTIGGVVRKLVEQQKIQRYRTPYQCRHTFITQCLEAGITIPLLAKWVGNSPEVIMRHYAGVLTQMQVPVF